MLIGLLVLDLVGIPPGATLASVIAAVVLLALDARGLLTLNGLIRWRAIRGWPRLVMVVAAIAFFQVLVAIYLVQRIVGTVAGGVASHAPARTSTAPSATRNGRPPAGPVESDLSVTEPDADAIQRGLLGLLADTRTRLPHDLLEKVTAVVAAIIDVLPAYRESGLDAHDRFTVARTATDYLPSSLRSYLKVPAAYRSAHLPDADGKTADEVLAEQLDLMLRRMRGVADVAYRKDVQDLLVHGRFLRSKFGGHGLTIDS